MEQPVPVFALVNLNRVAIENYNMAAGSSNYFSTPVGNNLYLGNVTRQGDSAQITFGNDLTTHQKQVILGDTIASNWQKLQTTTDPAEKKQLWNGIMTSEAQGIKDGVTGAWHSIFHKSLLI